MTVGKLKEMLEGLDDETPVRIMSQENYPFENAIFGLWLCPAHHESDGAGEDSEDDEIGFRPRRDRFSEEAHDGEVFYIVEGDQIGYGFRQAWELCDRE